MNTLAKISIHSLRITCNQKNSGERNEGVEVEKLGRNTLRDADVIMNILRAKMENVSERLVNNKMNKYRHFPFKPRYIEPP